MVLIALALASSVGATAPDTESIGSAFFSLSPPSLSRQKAGVYVSGRVCRLGAVTLLSPEWVRIEHHGAGGSEIARAEIPPIHRGVGQSCANYGVEVNWEFAAGDLVRACFDRGKACPPPQGSR